MVILKGRVIVSSLITSAEPKPLNPSDKLKDAACTISSYGIAPVVDDKGKLVGVLTAFDIVSLECRGVSLDEPVEKYMRRDFTAINMSWDLERALITMMIENANTAPVVDDKGVYHGVITLSRIASFISEEVDVDEIPAAD